MDNKLTQFTENREYLALNGDDRAFLTELCGKWQFSSSQIRQIIRIGRDLETWDEGSLEKLWGEKDPLRPGDRNEKENRYKKLCASWEELKNNPKDYSGFRPEELPPDRLKHSFQEINDERRILGDCPVASSKTRCCNLKTLDAVAGCGFDCSYCSIQSFYTDGKILFHGDLGKKLQNLDLNPEKFYHIGTGQSSDSLMWGDRDGLLEELCGFAVKNPNVILELKTKSAKTDALLKLNPPSNMLLTWSLNTPAVIAAEERLTSTLDERLAAARKAADRGLPVGFHLHPMVWYKGWEVDYAVLFGKMRDMFSPKEVVTVSFGTLTFIKPVIKKLRERPLRSKILQMPLVETAGKWSYPVEIKTRLFTAAAEGLSSWKDEVFFYLCMEDPALWMPVFGKEYADNDEFEKDMIYNYRMKMSQPGRQEKKQ